MRQAPAPISDTFFTNKPFSEQTDVTSDRRMAAFHHLGGKVLTASYTTELQAPLVNPYDVTTADQHLWCLPAGEIVQRPPPSGHQKMEEYATPDSTTRREEVVQAL